MTLRSTQALLRGFVDYAGLFPPAGLPMGEAAAEYGRRRRGSDAWILGRFVVPAARLDELAAAREEIGIEEAWPVSVLAGEAPASIPESLPPGLRLEAVELRAGSADEAARVLSEAPDGIDRFLEIPVREDLVEWITTLRDAGGFGKIRCGGITPDAIPSVGDVARFLSAVVEADLPFKATAGLHHPLRGEYRLTYEKEPPAGTMHGYLNLLLATALLRGTPRPEPAEILALLEERSPEAFSVRDGALEWKGRVLELDELGALRDRFLSVGSCSFREPVDEARALGWLR